MTNAEKAKRYDALQCAIKVYIESYSKQIHAEMPEKLQGSLRYYELGMRKAKEDFVEVMGRWVE